MRYFLIPAVMLMATATAAAAQDVSSMLGSLSEADVNRDGSITRAELVTSRANNFQRFDRNQDGVLSLTDIPAFLRSSSTGEQFKQLLTQFDANRDGKVTRDEFVNGPTTFFDMADANHDNVVARAELDAAVAKARAAKR